MLTCCSHDFQMIALCGHNAVPHSALFYYWVQQGATTYCPSHSFIFGYQMMERRCWALGAVAGAGAIRRLRI